MMKSRRCQRTTAPVSRTSFIVVLLALAVVGAAAEDNAVQRARYLFDHRHLEPWYEAEAWRILADYRAIFPLDAEAIDLWCQVSEDLGDNTADRAKKEYYYRVAEAAADTLRSEFPSIAAGHFWWAAAHGKRALARGRAAAILTAPTVIGEFKRAIALDPGFPLPYAVLGVLYRDLPLLAGGSRARSRSYLMAGLEQAPNLTLLRLELARLDMQERRYTDARRQLEMILSTERPYFEAAFVVNDRPLAESLLAEIRGK